MIHIAIKFHEKEDPTPAINIPIGTEIIDLQFTDAVISEEGTVNKKSAITFGGFHEGKYFVFQTTSNMLEGIYAAMKGVEQRWADKKANKN